MFFGTLVQNNNNGGGDYDYVNDNQKDGCRARCFLAGVFRDRRADIIELHKLARHRWPCRLKHNERGPRNAAEFQPVLR